MNKQFIALVSISALAYMGFNFLRKHQKQPEMVIELGPFEFIAPKNKWVDDIINRLRMKTKVKPLIDGIEIVFPPLPALSPSGLGTIYITPKPKKYTYKTLTQRQIFAIAKEIRSKIQNIKIEVLGNQSRVTIPQIIIPIYKKEV